MTISVGQGCLLSPRLFNLFLGRIRQENFHNHNTINGRPVCILHFTDNVDLMVGSSSELQGLTNKLVERVGIYGMEPNTEKSKVMVNRLSNAIAKITMDGELLEEVFGFKYLVATPSKNGTCNSEICIRVTIA